MPASVTTTTVVSKNMTENVETSLTGEDSQLIISFTFTCLVGNPTTAEAPTGDG